MEISFDDNGDPSFDGKGFTKADGSICKKISDWLASALGGKGVQTKLKPEYQADTAKNQARIKE